MDQAWLDKWVQLCIWQYFKNDADQRLVQERVERDSRGGTNERI